MRDNITDQAYSSLVLSLTSDSLRLQERSGEEYVINVNANNTFLFAYGDTTRDDGGRQLIEGGSILA